MPRAQSPFALLRRRPFLVYWLAGLSANFGWQIQLVAASWLMTTLDGSPELVASVQASVALPVMLLSLPGGAISDMIGERKLVLWSQSFLMSVCIALAICAYLEILTPLLLLTCTFLIGSGRALYYPGWQAMIFEFVSKTDAVPAIALNSSSLNIARSLGPAIGGALVTIAGAFVAFVISALSNLSVVDVARRWPAHRKSGTLPPEPFASAMLAGVRYVALSPMLVVIMLRSAVFNVAAIAVLALLPLVAKDLLHGGPESFGILLGAFGAGAVAGAVVIDDLRQKVSIEPFIAIGFLGFAVSAATLAWSHFLPLSMAGAAIGGLSWVLVQVTLYSTAQVSSPRWVLSRSIAIYQMFVFGGNALGSVIWGLVAGQSGTSVALLASAVVMAIGSSFGLAFRIREPDSDKLDQDSEWSAPQPKLDMVLTSGPIMTTVTYRIREEDASQFVDAMREKRRNRIRDGAFRWTLSRDIQDPTVWFERFKVATWAEAQRLHARRTVAGAQVIAYLRNLHQGPGLPEVHYELIRDPSAGTWRSSFPPRMDH
ncbi:MFS transporter [Rhizobium leguminosarum]|uniref:MFS transporter n=1 Tax=Rhizobium TaxID=379 RepID=UPI001C989A13|nr:MFS transporter [Rhizobium leguminosarum]MBY5392840.1 MFS transporter [Rhizobium leguminosarum]MBY5434492.1 MFS transporter [Rhizobium leguminosarum]